VIGRRGERQHRAGGGGGRGHGGHLLIGALHGRRVRRGGGIRRPTYLRGVVTYLPMAATSRGRT
jgi:hypothetical protein